MQNWYIASRRFIENLYAFYAHQTYREGICIYIYQHFFGHQIWSLFLSLDFQLTPL